MGVVVLGCSVIDDSRYCKATYYYMSFPSISRSFFLEQKPKSDICDITMSIP